ncbi:hypothetical protein KKF84_10280 [Myxococcota bacterium]|nr:hypothetical protein [Myxococcota bacterium]MBU1535698.1 hypothetical protein [Myxococcota bacterium]
MENSSTQTPESRTDKQKKPYTPPQLLSEKVFATDALGGCRMASFADGCGTRRDVYLSSL